MHAMICHAICQRTDDFIFGVGLSLLFSKICPLCFLAFPKFLPISYAHFYDSQYKMLTDYGEN